MRNDAGDFCFDEAKWARCSRHTLEFWKEAEASLQAAVKLYPAATELVFLLVHLLCCAGKIQEVAFCSASKIASAK